MLASWPGGLRARGRGADWDVRGFASCEIPTRQLVALAIHGSAKSLHAQPAPRPLAPWHDFLRPFLPVRLESMAAESADGFRELNVIVPAGSEHSKSQVLQHRREKEQSDHGEWDGCQSACPDSDDLDKAIDVGRCGSLACAIAGSSEEAWLFFNSGAVQKQPAGDEYRQWDADYCESGNE